MLKRIAWGEAWRWLLWWPRLFSRAGFTGLLLVVFLASPVGADEPEFQLWGNFTLSWIKSHHVTLGVDIEPKVLVSKPADDPRWATLDVTPSLEYTHGNWLDIVSELLVARTKQTDDDNSTEITPRIGFRFHILSNVANDLLKEKLPKHRFVIRDLIRLEWRNLYYSPSSGTPDSSSLRLRNRVEISYPINRRRMTDDGAIYATGDGEWFWTEEDQSERFASKQRIRVGIGHRRSYRWRFEALYVWDRSRHTATDGFTTADSAVDVQVKRVW
jgi:hypothetical protein